MKKLYIWDDAKRKNVLTGYISGRTYYRNINPRRHFIRAIGGYGIQEEIIDKLIHADVRTICFKMSRPKKVFKLSLKKFLEKMKPISTKITGKHGAQVGIWLSQMEEYGGKGAVLPTQGKSPLEHPTPSKQGELYG